MDNRENARTVKEFLTTHVGASFSMMTPGGYVDLTAEQAERLLDGQGAVAHPGVAGITMALSSDELLGQIVDSSNWKDGVWYLMTRAPAVKQCASETDRRFAVLHVTEGGSSSYFLAEENLEFLQTAQRLRSYIHKGDDDAPVRFIGMLPCGKKLSREQFEMYVSERLDNTGRVVGAFHVDLDDGRIDALNIMDGWKRFRIPDVSSAAYFAMQENGASPENQWRTFLDHLQGKEVTYESEPQYLTGSRTLRAEDISFAGDIVPNGHLLEFYMDPIFDADAVFGTNVCTTENDDWLNAYANYDLERGCVCDTLIVDLDLADGSEQECRYRLSSEEQALLLPKMDAYCVEQFGMDLKSCVNQYRSELSNQWGQQSSQTI